MKQKSFASNGFALVTKHTRKCELLAEMNSVVPWVALVSLIDPHAPSGKTGRPPFAVLTLLRIHFMRQWFGLSDPASIRAKVEHPFRVLKCQFGFTKVRYKELAKNTAQLLTLFALSNLWMAKKRII